MENLSLSLVQHVSSKLIVTEKDEENESVDCDHFINDQEQRGRGPKLDDIMNIGCTTDDEDVHRDLDLCPAPSDEQSRPELSFKEVTIYVELSGISFEAESSLVDSSTQVCFQPISSQYDNRPVKLRCNFEPTTPEWPAMTRTAPRLHEGFTIFSPTACEPPKYRKTSARDNEDEVAARYLQREEVTVARNLRPRKGPLALLPAERQPRSWPAAPKICVVNRSNWPSRTSSACSMPTPEVTPLGLSIIRPVRAGTREPQLPAKTIRKRCSYPKEYYFCRVCEYRSSVEVALRRHVDGHLECGAIAAATMVSCVVCGLDSATLVDNAAHLARHHQTGSWFLCDLCKFQSVQLKKLVQHRRKHTLEKPHRCSMCDYCSTRRDNLHSHARRIHKIPRMPQDTFTQPEINWARVIREATNNNNYFSSPHPCEELN